MENNKCAHPACLCAVPDEGDFGSYCSEHCKEAGDIAEIECECGHPACNAETKKALDGPPHTVHN